MSSTAAITLSPLKSISGITNHFVTNSNLYFRACATYLAYFGVKYIAADIDKYCNFYLDNAIVKLITLYSIMYNSVQDVYIAFIMAFFIFIVTQFLRYTTTDILHCSDADDNDKSLDKSKTTST